MRKENGDIEGLRVGKVGDAVWRGRGIESLSPLIYESWGSHGELKTTKRQIKSHGWLARVVLDYQEPPKAKGHATSATSQCWPRMTQDERRRGVSNIRIWE